MLNLCVLGADSRKIRQPPTSLANGCQVLSCILVVNISWHQRSTLERYLFHHSEIKVLCILPAKWHATSWQLCIYEANGKLVKKFPKQQCKLSVLPCAFWTANKSVNKWSEYASNFLSKEIWLHNYCKTSVICIAPESTCWVNGSGNC